MAVNVRLQVRVHDRELPLFVTRLVRTNAAPPPGPPSKDPTTRRASLARPSCSASRPTSAWTAHSATWPRRRRCARWRKAATTSRCPGWTARCSAAAPPSPPRRTARWGAPVRGQTQERQKGAGRGAGLAPSCGAAGCAPAMPASATLCRLRHSRVPLRRCGCAVQQVLEGYLLQGIEPAALASKVVSAFKEVLHESAMRAVRRTSDAPKQLCLQVWPGGCPSCEPWALC